ncbi:hypothetical protein P7M38_25250, partial [Vibrio parahaemolyticus]|nr:hypothetical protein [Vibrio parahaemolyticus]
ANIIVSIALYGNQGYIIFQSTQEDCKSAARHCFLNEERKRKKRKYLTKIEGKIKARYHKDSTTLNQSLNYFEGNLW